MSISLCPYVLKQLKVIEGLSYFLPDSPYYALLSSLPPPDSTNPTATTTFEAQDAVHNGYRILQEVVSLTESLEDDFFKKEVEKRRMRLGAPSPEVIRKEVFLETFKKSKVGLLPSPPYILRLRIILQLSSLYESILNHPNTSDEVRVEVEAKQLRYKQQYLQSLPSSKESAALKEKAARELEDIIEGIVLLQKPDELGWRIFLETRDYEHLCTCNRIASSLVIDIDTTSLQRTTSWIIFEGTFDCSLILDWPLCLKHTTRTSKKPLPRKAMKTPQSILSTMMIQWILSWYI